jgi:hypothetical protein
MVKKAERWEDEEGRENRKEKRGKREEGEAESSRLKAQS